MRGLQHHYVSAAAAEHLQATYLPLWEELYIREGDPVYPMPATSGTSLMGRGTHPGPWHDARLSSSALPRCSPRRCSRCARRWFEDDNQEGDKLHGLGTCGVQ